MTVVELRIKKEGGGLLGRLDCAVLSKLKMAISIILGEELLTLQRCLESQTQQARDDDIMEALSHLYSVLNLLSYSLEAVTRQHHLIH